MVKASEVTMEDFITMEDGKVVFPIAELDVCARYIGRDKYFEYWIGIDGKVYGL